MKSFLYISFLTLLLHPAKAQDCSQNLDDAKRAYYNGQVEQVPKLLEGCLENLDRGDLLDAYKILIYSYLIEGEAEKADEYMVALLRTEPLYQVQGSDLQEFKNLRNSFSAISKYTVGLTMGPMRPDYQIMRHYSAAGNVAEPTDYNEHPGISIGITGDVRLVDKLYANISLLYDRRSFDQEEIIFGLQRVHSDETQQRLTMPLLLRYVQPIKNWNVFAGGGYGFHYLLKATGDFLHIPLESETPRIDGTPYLAEDVDITEQHKRLTRSWQLACGIQRPFNKYTVELSFSYERGLSNTIDDDNRHFVNGMNENFAYVPDDVRVHAYKINIAFYRTFYKPQRKK
jgi:hypothetical protein